jgi:protein involved in polysaccharide export with SLBB domain
MSARARKKYPDEGGPRDQIMIHPKMPGFDQRTGNGLQRGLVNDRTMPFLVILTFLWLVASTVQATNSPPQVIQPTNGLSGNLPPALSNPLINPSPVVVQAITNIVRIIGTNVVSPVATNIVSMAATNALMAGPTNNSVASSTNVLKASLITSMDALDEKHRLAIGDRLSFRIEEDEEDPRPLVVTDSGELEMPYLGRYPAENKTCKQLALELKTALEKDYYYHATVIIAVDYMAKTRGRVYLVGPVRAPGPQEIPSDEILTISKAILRAGGFTEYADKRNVKITRKGGSGSDNLTFIVDVGQILDKAKTEKDVPLEPGDLILIPERLFRF